MFVKICGITQARDVEAVAHFEPDAMGFIFWRGAKRYVDPVNVGEWAAGLSRRILKVGVFVDPEPAEVARAIEIADLDVVQLHGRETAAFARSISTTVWKATTLSQPLPDPLTHYLVDCFVVDGHSKEAPGGTGTRADWSLAADFAMSCPRPVLLAGGLTPSNVDEAVRAVGPWGVDVSSGVEISFGQKDPHKVRDFIHTCRSHYE